MISLHYELRVILKPAKNLIIVHTVKITNLLGVATPIVGVTANSFAFVHDCLPSVVCVLMW